MNLTGFASIAYEAAAVLTVAFAGINALLRGGESSTWMAGCAIAFATLALVSEHRHREPQQVEEEVEDTDVMTLFDYSED